jgi:transketolase
LRNFKDYFMQLNEDESAQIEETYIDFLKHKAKYVRQTVLEMSVAAQSGHVTTAFSQAELLVALYYGNILNVKSSDPRWSQRDRFILSKGQGGIGLYPILADLGFFNVRELENFAQEGSKLGVHAEWSIPGIELLTGSLGHGLPMATGIALKAKVDKENYLTFCLLGDGEMHEGSNWEAMFFANHYRLNNLICIIDRNKQSTLGFHDSESEFCDMSYHKDGPCLNPLDKKFEAFGFEVKVIDDGHNFKQIFNAFYGIRSRQSTSPLVIIVKTLKGRGSIVTENQRLWHYRVPSGDDLEQIRKDLNKGLDLFDKEKNNG